MRMTWEETILKIRKNPEYHLLIRQSYLDEDIKLNVDRFKSSEEFYETINIVKKHAPVIKSIADIGAGNGISAVAFSLRGYDVEAIEPDASTTVGRGAINILKEEYRLSNL